MRLEKGHLQTSDDVSSGEAGNAVTETFSTSLAHRGYALVRVAYLLFAFVFLFLFSSESWFSLDLSSWSLPTLALLLVLAHGTLVLLESNLACRIFRFVARGRPAVSYLRWATLERAESSGSAEFPAKSSEDADSRPDALRYGRRRIVLSAIDELELTFWNNLLIKSSALSGHKDADSISESSADSLDTVLKLPFGVISPTTQRRFISTIRNAKPDVRLSKRLEKRMNSKLVKGESIIQTLGAVFLLVVLIDLNCSLFTYLQMLKGYHQAQVVARYPDSIRARGETSWEVPYESAERLRKSPSPLSWVSKGLLQKGFAAASVDMARAEALWYGGRKGEAIDSLSDALKEYPRSLHIHLELARWLTLEGQEERAKKVLEESLEIHPDSMLPRLYSMSLLRRKGQMASARKMMTAYSQELDEAVFSEEPWWPPGGNRFVVDMWGRSDIDYLMQNLLFPVEDESKKENDARN